jgi:hypothetical protein
MGAIWFKRSGLLGAVGEMVGYKAGIALDQPHIVDLSGKDLRTYLHGGMDEDVRIRSEEFEQLLAMLLYRVGNTTSPSIAPIGITLFHEVKDEPERLAVFLLLVDQMTERLNQLLAGRGAAAIHIRVIIYLTDTLSVFMRASLRPEKGNHSTN